MNQALHTSFSNREMMDLTVNDEEHSIIDIAMVANGEEGQNKFKLSFTILEHHIICLLTGTISRTMFPFHLNL